MKVLRCCFIARFAAYAGRFIYAKPVWIDKLAICVHLNTSLSRIDIFKDCGHLTNYVNYNVVMSRRYFFCVCCILKICRKNTCLMQAKFYDVLFAKITQCMFYITSTDHRKIYDYCSIMIFKALAEPLRN